MIPEKAQGKVNEATVVATGPGITKVMILISIHNNYLLCHHIHYKIFLV